MHTDLKVKALGDLSDEVIRLTQSNTELLEALEKIVDLAKTGAPLHSIGPGYFEDIQQVAGAAIKKAKDGR